MKTCNRTTRTYFIHKSSSNSKIMFLLVRDYHKKNLFSRLLLRKAASISSNLRENVFYCSSYSVYSVNLNGRDRSHTCLKTYYLELTWTLNSSYSRNRIIFLGAICTQRKVITDLCLRILSHLQ